RAAHRRRGVRGEVDVHGPPAGLSRGDRADPMVRQAGVADARERPAGGPGGVGPLPDPVLASGESSPRPRRRLMDTPALGRTARAALPIVAILSFTLGLAATLAVPDNH